MWIAKRTLGCSHAGLGTWRNCSCNLHTTSAETPRGRGFVQSPESHPFRVHNVVEGLGQLCKRAELHDLAVGDAEHGDGHDDDHHQTMCNKASVRRAPADACDTMIDDGTLASDVEEPLF